MSLRSPCRCVNARQNGRNQMAERRSRRGGSAREATFDGSSRIAALGGGLRASGGVAIGVAATGALAALLLALTEFLTVASVDVASGSCQVINDANPELADRCTLSGFERHGGAFVLLALLTLAMALGAGVLAVTAGAVRLLRPD